MAAALPFAIQKFVFQPDGQVSIVNLDDSKGTPGQIPGYFVMSSATPDIDPQPLSDSGTNQAKKRMSNQVAHRCLDLTPEEQQQSAQQGIKEIADHLHRIMASNPAGGAELVITVHGYNTSRRRGQAWYGNIFKYVNRHDPNIMANPNQVFIGYRWPSENVKLGRFLESLLALPPLPRDIFITGVVGFLLFVGLQIFALDRSLWGGVLSVAFGVAMVLGLLMFALVVLRLVGYFRDNYRANNFGVLDLVELLRQIDHAMVKHAAEEMYPGLAQASPMERARSQAQARSYWARHSPKNRVKLSFIGHSMGAFVVTNVVRILSDVFDDVFDTDSIGQRPNSNIGDVFRLERLVLASPDIPVLTIITSRANFLASSLRRFSESYLFSSEGDIALRIASTAANYIAFPSRTQARGYRLGNVALRNPQNSQNPASRLRYWRRRGGPLRNPQNPAGTPADYGLINLNALDQEFPPDLPLSEAIAQAKNHNVMKSLFLTFKRFQSRGVVTLASLFEDPASACGKSNQATIADLFTYFDCTDYVDVRCNLANDTCSDQPTGLLTKAQGKPVLKTWDYFWLTLDYATGRRDVHGGYFEGQFSQQLIYGLAFLGFGNYLKTFHADPHTALSQLHLACQEKGIQGHLSPFRYRMDIQGGNLDSVMQDMLRAIEVNTEQARIQRRPAPPATEAR